MAMNLWQKMSAVMKDIEYLAKDDSISMGKGSSYKAISEEKVTRTVRESLIKNGLVIIPTEQEHFREDFTSKDSYGNDKVTRLTTVNVKYKIIDIETGNFEILSSSGTGVDSQDKGVGKAMTYCFKYALLRSFAIPTGEDPDKIASDMLDEQDKPTNVIPLAKEKKSTKGVINESQVKRLYTLAGLAGYKQEDVKHHMEVKFKITSTDDLTKAQYDTICKGYEGAKDKKDGEK